ncbi:MAG: hypothetical protein IJK64_09990 [Clostridia bacterium]|nr:hypothetical protein [Clostridia bacterium]
MTEERKILTLSLTVAAASAAVPAVLGVLKNLRPKPLAASDRLHADGAGFADTAGSPVTLHAVELPTAPSVFLRDGEACPPEDVEPALTERFGAYGAKQLLQAERFGALTAADLKTLKGLGVNCVQVPLCSNRLCKKKNGRDEIDFTAVDALVDRCRAAGVYVLPLLTALPDALLQNCKAGFDARNAVLRQWLQIAEHYKDEPAIAGFSLLDGAALAGADPSCVQALQKFGRRLVKTLRSAGADFPLFLPAAGDSLPDLAGCGENLAVSLDCRALSPAVREALRLRLPADLPCLVTVSDTDDPVGALAEFADLGGLCFAGFFGARGCLFAAFTGDAPDLVRDDYKTLTEKCGAVLDMRNLKENAALCDMVKDVFGGAVEDPKPKTTVRFGLNDPAAEA